MSVGGCLQIQYSGAAVSCILEADAAAKTLSSRIGAAGAEVLDPTFGTMGVIDLTAVGFDTLEDLQASIDAYADYLCDILYGDDIPTENVLDATVQAKADPGHILFTLVSVLSPYALTSWERVKLFLGLADSAQLQTEYLLNAITASAERIAKRSFAARAVTKDFDGDGRNRLILPAYPAASITRVNIDSNRVFEAADDLDPEDYALYSEEGIIALIGGIFPWGIQNVHVEWLGGFSPIPDDLQFAAVECVSWNRIRLEGNAIGTRNIISPDGVNTGMEIAIPLSAQRVFESYRDVR